MVADVILYLLGQTELANLHQEPAETPWQIRNCNVATLTKLIRGYEVLGEVK